MLFCYSFSSKITDEGFTRTKKKAWALNPGLFSTVVLRLSECRKVAKNKASGKTGIHSGFPGTARQGRCAV